MKSEIKAKLKASGIHLAISSIIFIGILYLILIEWYPEPFFTAEGGWRGIKLMAMVDLVLGPSLTLIIYNCTKSKKEILFDLSIVAVIQISAMIWGGLQVHSARPVALVMWEGIFYTVTEDYYQNQNISMKDVATFSDEKPFIIYAETDHSVAQLEKIQSLNEQKIPPYAQVHLYKSVKDNVNKVLHYQLLDELLLTNFKYKNTQPDSAVALHAFSGKAKYEDLTVILDSDTKLVDIVSKQ